MLRKIESYKLDKNTLQMIRATIFSLILTIPASYIHAGTPSGAQFLKLNPSARSYALGRSNTVSALGAQAISANPANVHKMNSRIELFSAFFSLMEGAQYAHAATAITRSPSGDRIIDAVGFSASQLKIGGLEGRDAQGELTGSSFGSQDMMVAVSASSRLRSGLLLGLTGKAIQLEIAGYKSNVAIATDLGMSYETSLLARSVTFGASINNLGQGTKFINQVDPLPLSVNAGMGVGFGPAMGVLEVSRLMNEGKTNFSLGLEYGLGPVSLRGGYRVETGAGNNLALQNQEGMIKMFSGITTGLGIHLGSANLDYAISQDVVEFGLSHRVAVTIKFGDRSNATIASLKAKPSRQVVETSKPSDLVRRNINK